MSEDRKRKHEASSAPDSSDPKKQKTRKPWQNKKSGGQRGASGSQLQPGDVGIWATCVLKQERKAVSELKDLFNDYAEQVYGEAASPNEDDAEQEIDIEAEIEGEIEALQKPGSKALFENIRLDTPCVLFLRTRPPVEPVSFVQKICNDIDQTGKMQTRYVKRLTPATGTAKATESGLLELAEQVLRPHFLEEDIEPKKYAIRPTIRNHTGALSRDTVIKKIASLLSPRHKVDLTKYDLLVLVEVYKNMCAMSVVGNWSENERLKRFNLAELGHRA